MSLKRKSAISVLAVGILAAIAGMALTFSAFTSTTENDGNSFVSGSVVLTDNALGTKLFDMAGMHPGTEMTKCLTVEYAGTLDADVKLYATTTSSAADKNLAPYLDLEIVRGSFPADATPAEQACDGFIAGATVPATTIGALPSSYATGIDLGTFATGDKAVYRMRVAIQNDDAAQAKDAITKLTFEAHDKVISAP